MSDTKNITGRMRATFVATPVGDDRWQAVLDVLHANGYRRCAEGQRVTQWCDRAEKSEAEVARLQARDEEWQRKASAWMASPEAAQRLDGYRELAQRLNAAEAEVERLRKGIAAVSSLIADSSGVYGLHLNGDPAPWDELLSGGRFEEWLAEVELLKTERESLVREAVNQAVQTGIARADADSLRAEVERLEKDNAEWQDGYSALTAEVERLRKAVNAMHKFLDRDFSIVEFGILLRCESHDQAWNYLHEMRDIVRAARGES